MSQRTKTNILQNKAIKRKELGQSKNKIKKEEEECLRRKRQRLINASNM